MNEDWVQIDGWLPGELVHITVNGTITRDVTVDASGQLFVTKEVLDVDLQPGDQIVASDAFRSSTLVVSDISFDALTLDSSSAVTGGRAPVNAQVSISLTDSLGNTVGSSTVLADVSSHWHATSPAPSDARCTETRSRTTSTRATGRTRGSRSSMPRSMRR